MAQIGSPPAGWYSDPSGQHRARYWDGASWTEQVRDDVSDPAATGAATGNPAAATVAGVAEAVAAVAATDVALSPGPPLVVDFGDAPWEGQPGANGNGSRAVADPFGVGPAPVAEAPVAEVPMVSEPTTVPESSVVAAPVAPMPAAVETPAAPVASGPPAGWYPDPTARHQARLWDGTRWTERVSDGGIEGFDPLSEAAAATSTVDPNHGAWSAELVDTAGAVAGQGGDGMSLSAGQRSLATLPDMDATEVAGDRTVERPSAKVRLGGGLVLAGAVALLFGSAMTWMMVTGPKVGDAWKSSGLDLGDGRITVALSVVLAVLGAAIITGRMARFGGTKVAAMGSLVAGAASLAVSAVDIADVADRSSRLGVPAGAVSNVGTGLWLVFMGSLLAVVGGLMAFANRR